MSQRNNGITSQVDSSPDFDNHLNNLIQCISDNDCDECESITSSQHFNSNEPLKNCNTGTFCQLSPISGIISSSLNEDKHLQTLQNINESTEVRQSINIGDDKVVVTELFLVHGSKSKTTNVVSKMSADFSKQGSNNSDKESIYKDVTHFTGNLEKRKTLKRKSFNYSGGVEQGQYCHLSSSWPCNSSKLRKYKCQFDSNSDSVLLHDKTYRAPIEELLLGETDKTCRAPIEQLLLGETDKACKVPIEEQLLGETDKTCKVPIEELLLEEKDNKTLRAPSEKILFGELNKICRAPSEELLFGEKDKTCRTPTEEILLGETDKIILISSEELLFGEMGKTCKAASQEQDFGETDKTCRAPCEGLLLGETDETLRAPPEELLFEETDKTCGLPSEELLFGEPDKINRASFEELLFVETESSHCKKTLEQEMLSESSETGIHWKSSTNMPRFTHSVNQHQKTIVEVHVTSQCVSDEPVLAQDRAKNMLPHTANESSVSFKMPVMDLNYAEHSQPVSPLYLNGESLPFLVHQTLSPSVILSKDLSNQTKINSLTSTSVRSNNFLMASTHSPPLSHAAPCLKEEPRSVELFSFPTSVESSSCDSRNISQHKKHPSHTDAHSVVCLSEKLHQNYINGNLPETTCKDLNCNPVTNLPHTNLGELTQADILPLPAVSTKIIPLQCEFSNIEHLRQDAVMPPIDSTIKITHELPSTFTKRSPVKIYERSRTPVYEISTRNVSLEYITALNSSVLELCQHQHQKHAMSSGCEYEYQELPRSPPMLMDLDGIPYSLPSDDHFVPQGEEVLEIKGECIIRKQESNTTITDKDHNYCEETKQELLSEADSLHSADANTGSVHENEGNLSWPKMTSTSTKHYQDSTRVSLSLSANLDDNNGTATIFSTEEIENTPQHCSRKNSVSHLSNKTSVLSFEDPVNNDDHRVPDAESIEKMCLSEISLYSDLPENRQDDLKCKQKTKQAFQWKTVYETQMNKSITDKTAGDSVFEGLSSIQPICQSHRPRRVGLSRKQKVKHLHNKQ